MKTGLPSVIRQDGAQAIPAEKTGAKQPVQKAQGRWLLGMVTGQVAFFALALKALPLFAHSHFVLPPVAVLPFLFSATLTGGLLGGFVHARLTRKAEAAPPLQMRAYIFQALAETNRRLAEMFVNEEFNEAANGNSDSRRMKAKPELKVAPPVAPRMGGM